jgi:secondary thiamine-phosphate synthase enzyme
MREWVVRTPQREGLVEITDRVAEAVRESGVESGACVVYCPHTTAGILVNEGYDPAVGEDLINFLATEVRSDLNWKHAEGNAPAHIKAMLVGSSAWIPIADGRLQLGRWQSIFLAEFDGPRERRVWLQLMAQR